MSEGELPRLIRARPVPAAPVMIEPTSAERAALARRFGLTQIAAMRAEIALESKGKAIRATGQLTAQVVQPCAVSGEDFVVAINEAIDLRFVEASAPSPKDDADPQAEIEITADDCDEIEYVGDAFDLGEAVAQTLGLAIDPYAEGPDADAARKRAGIKAEGEQEGPLAAALAALKKS